MRIKVLFFLAILIFIISGKIYSQYSTTGTEFWLSFHQNFEDNANPILYITSDVGATGTVSIPGTGWSEGFTVGINSSVMVNLPSATAIIATGNTVLNRGVYVESTTAIAVYAANQRTASSDATLIYPVHALGDSYIVNAYSPFSGNPSQFVVVGVQDNTSIEIIPTSNITGGVNAGVPFNITLNTGQVYFIRSNGDLTGTSVKATTVGECNNFAVFAGNKCANVPLSCTYCDHLYEQMIPTKAWGMEYVTVPLMTRNGDQFRIMAMEDNTTININNGANIMLNAGQFHETYLQPSSFIEGDKPISVAQYSRGTSCDGVTSDPFMIMISPIEQTLDYIVFQAFNTTNINQFYTNIVTKTEHTNQVLLNGATLPGWTTVPSNPEFSYNRRNLAQGTHVLQSPHGLLATVYGFGDVESYGYQAGANIQPLNVSFDIIVDGDSIAFDVFQDSLNCQQAINGVSFSTDATNITDIYWDFGDGNTATGPNVSHTYSSSGMFTVTMYFTRIESCVEESLSVDVYVSSELPPFDFINDTVVCNGVPFTIYPGAAGVNYLWQDGTTNSYHNVSTSGTYAVTVSDNMGCSAEATADVLFIDMQLQTDVDDITCAGMSDGSITVNASGGDSPYTYNWSTIPPVTTQTATGLGQGTYFVTVTDANGCTRATSANIVNPDTFYGEIVLQEDVSCYGASDGVVEIHVQGGVPPYGIVWSNSSLFGMFQQDLGPGNYSFTVNDVNGCTSEHSITIYQPDSIAVFENLLNAACHGQPVSASISPSGGTPPFTIYWESGATGFTNNSVPTNTDFSYTVTDANTCSYIGFVHVTSPPPFVIVPNITPVKCHGDANGGIRINVSGSTPPIQIEWSSGEDSVAITNKPAGYYTVTIRDANNCAESESFYIPQSDAPLTLDYNVNDLRCFGDSQGSIFLDASGGTHPYSYRLNNGEHEVNGNNHAALQGGLYNFRVIDAYGCEVGASAIINEPAPLEAELLTQRPSCIGNNDGYIKVNVFGGTEPYIYNFDNKLSDFNSYTGLKQGIFNLTVYDANNCKQEFDKIRLVDVPVDCITIPNAFTPNGDGINDTWIIDNIGMFPDAVINVFNRWGQEVYFDRGNGEPWDGTYDGKFLPTGSYVYVVNLQNGTKEYKGTVTIIY